MTSRRALRVAGEREHQVPPLEIPDSDADPDEIAASDRRCSPVRTAGDQGPGGTSNSHRTNVRAVAAICRALDGLPLAVELTAARVKLMSPTAILSRLDSVLDLGRGGAGRPDRQRTLRETIEWWYGLLTPEQRDVFMHLGVFKGSIGLTAIEAVLPPPSLNVTDVLDVMADLVDASLVVTTSPTMTSLVSDCPRDDQGLRRGDTCPGGCAPTCCGRACQPFRPALERVGGDAAR